MTKKLEPIVVPDPTEALRAVVEAGRSMIDLARSGGLGFEFDPDFLDEREAEGDELLKRLKS